MPDMTVEELAAAVDGTRGIRRAEAIDGRLHIWRKNNYDGGGGGGGGGGNTDAEVASDFPQGHINQLKNQGYTPFPEDTDEYEYLEIVIEE